MPQGKAEFLATLCSNGVFRTVGDLVASESPQVRRLAVDIVSQSCQMEPGVLRGYIVDEEERGRSCSLLPNMVAWLVSESSEDFERVEMVEILKQVLETGQKATTQIPERAVVTSAEEMAKLLEVFYESCLMLLVKPLLREPDASVSSLFHLLDMFAFCVVQHTDEIRKAIIQHNLIGTPITPIYSAVKYFGFRNERISTPHL